MKCDFVLHFPTRDIMDIIVILLVLLTKGICRRFKDVRSFAYLASDHNEKKPKLIDFTPTNNMI